MKIIFAIAIAALLGACVPAAMLVPVVVSGYDAYQTAKPVVIEIKKLHDLRRSK